MTDSPSAHGWRGSRHVPAILVAAACLLNLVLYRHTVTIAAPEMNDHVLHFALVEGAVRAFQRGESPHDFWLPLWGQGFPVARYYQNLPHLMVALTHVASGGIVPLALLYRGALLAGLSLLPLALALGTRALGMSALGAALVAVCSTVLGADRGEPYFLGMQAEKYLSLHGGLFPQLFGLIAFALAVGVAFAHAAGGTGAIASMAAPATGWRRRDAPEGAARARSPCSTMRGRPPLGEAARTSALPSPTKVGTGYERSATWRTRSPVVRVCAAPERPAMFPPNRPHARRRRSNVHDAQAHARTHALHPLRRQ